MTVHTWVGTSHGQWHAVAIDFQLAGVGATKDAACRDLSGVLETYLRCVYEQGRPYEDSLRPMTSLTKLRLFMPLRDRHRLRLFPVH